MGRRTEWPWSLEEEAEWKAELEEGAQDFVEELMGDNVEDDLSSSPDVIGTPENEPEDSIPENIRLRPNCPGQRFLSASAFVSSSSFFLRPTKKPKRRSATSARLFTQCVAYAATAFSKCSQSAVSSV